MDLNAKPDASLPPGYDDEDPYEDADLSTYPDWWRRNIELHQRYGLRPYRPPRFNDGILTTDVIGRLEDETGARIRIQSKNPQAAGTWTVTVDGQLVGTIDHYRDGNGYTVYDMDSETFTDLILEEVD